MWYPHKRKENLNDFIFLHYFSLVEQSLPDQPHNKYDGNTEFWNYDIDSKKLWLIIKMFVVRHK